MILKLTNQIKKYAEESGANLVGICDFDSSDYRLEDKKDIDPFNKAIVIGCRHSDSTFRLKNIRPLQYDTYGIMQELSQISYRLVRFLEEKGYETITFSPYIPVEMSIETKGFFGDISHRHLAVKAGLGCLGYCRLLVNPNLGPRIRLASVLTSAELEQDEEYKEDLCKGCEKLCASACPVNAITDDGIDVNKCVKENIKHGIPGLIGLRKKIADTNDISDYLKNYLLEPTFWRIWQSTTSGIFYDCFECMKACPIGQKSKK